MSRKKTDIWMPLYIAEYLGDTMHLTTRQHGAYLLLIMAYWRNASPLPNNERQLAAICKLHASEWAEDRDTLAEFFEIDHTYWRHKRIDTELVNALENVLKASEKGKAGAAARWQKDCQNDATGNTSSNATSSSTGNASSPSPLPLPKTKPKPTPKKHTPAAADVDAVFDHWRVRMNHQGAKLDDKRKKTIRKAFELGYSLTDLIAAIDGCAKSEWHMGQNTDGKVWDQLTLILRDAEHVDRFIKQNSQQLIQRGDGTYETEQQRVARLSKSAAGRVQLNAERELAAIATSGQGDDGLPLDHDGPAVRPQMDLVVRG